MAGNVIQKWPVKAIGVVFFQRFQGSVRVLLFKGRFSIALAQKGQIACVLRAENLAAKYWPSCIHCLYRTAWTTAAPARQRLLEWPSHHASGSRKVPPMHFMSWVRSSQKEILSRRFKCKWFIRAVLPGVQNGEGGELRKETSGEIPGSARFQKKRYSVNCEFVMTQGNWALCLFMDSLWVTPGRQTPGHFWAAPHKSKVDPVTPGKSSEKCYKQNVQKGKHTSRVKKIEESDQGINWGLLSLLLCGYLGKYSTIPLNPYFPPLWLSSWLFLQESPYCLCRLSVRKVGKISWIKTWTSAASYHDYYT